MHTVGSLRFLAPLGPDEAARAADLGFFAVGLPVPFFFFLPPRAARSASIIACATLPKVVGPSIVLSTPNVPHFHISHSTAQPAEIRSRGRGGGWKVELHSGCLRLLHVACTLNLSLPWDPNRPAALLHVCSLQDSQLHAYVHRPHPDPKVLAQRACRFASSVRMSASAVRRTPSNTSGRSPSRITSRSGRACPSGIKKRCG